MSQMSYICWSINVCKSLRCHMYISGNRAYVNYTVSQLQKAMKAVKNG